MTIADKLIYLSDTKTQIKNAIENKGVVVPAGTTFREYATKISEITTGEPAPAIPVPSPATTNSWEGAFSNDNAQYAMDYSEAEIGDTVITVLFYYDEGAVTINPTGYLEPVGTSVGGSNTLDARVTVFKHEKKADDPNPITISPAGTGRRQIGYYYVPPIPGYEVVVDLLDTAPVPISENHSLNILAQENTSSYPVLRCVSLAWSTASNPSRSEADTLRYINLPPKGFSGILNTFNDQGGTSNQNRSFTFGTILRPGETAEHTLIPYLTATTGNTNGLACVTYDIYYAPTP